MADASRFPKIAFPFAVVGAAAGWLSADLCDNPLLHYDVLRPAAAGFAALMGALTGAILRKLCIGRRYEYEIGEPDASIRPSTDAWLLHAVIVLAAGAATGALMSAASFGRGSLPAIVFGATLCAAAFVPVCLAVLAAGRSAQRARLGSLVAAADRRAVWGILAALLAVATLEALPDWPAWTAGEGLAPFAVPIVLLAAATVTLMILVDDVHALRRARAAVGAGFSERDPGQDDLDASGLPKLDLGLGAGTLALIACGGAPYRDHDRPRALVLGSPAEALGALRRAVRRGGLSLAAIGAVIAAHLWATTDSALIVYEEQRCASWNPAACELAATFVSDSDPPRARLLRHRAHPWRQD